MSERKVLNKYYPPDFDPSKIPRLKIKRDGKFGIRLMAPFNMRCNTCGEYIYKGKKFNSRKETVEDEKYLGLHIFRFYIKCPRCIAEIAFKTDPENTDYTLEAGATRNFEALRTAEKLALKEQEEKEAEEKNNPMKVLENRTKASLQEMDMIETLEELRDMRQKHGALSLDTVLRLNEEDARELVRCQAEKEEQEDEEFVRSVFGKDGNRVVKRLDSDDDYDDDDDATGSCFKPPAAKIPKTSVKASDLLTIDLKPSTSGSSNGKKATNNSTGPINGAITTQAQSSSTLKSSVDSSAKSSTLNSTKKSLLGGIIVRPKSSAKVSTSGDSSTTCISASFSSTVAHVEPVAPGVASVLPSVAGAAQEVKGATVSASAADSGGDPKSNGSLSEVKSGGLLNLASYYSGSDSE